MSKRDRQKRIIRALKQKTTERGATEAEAIAAAKKIAQILEEYNLTLEEVEIEETNCVSAMAQMGNEKFPHPAIMTASTVAQLTGTKALQTLQHTTRDVYLTFMGFPQDVKVACYMLELIRNAMEHEYTEFTKTTDFLFLLGSEATKKHSFQMGMAMRVVEKLLEMIKDQEATRAEYTNTQNALIVSKSDAVLAEVEKHFGELPKQDYAEEGKEALDQSFAAASGYQAGDNVQFNEGLDDGRDS